MLVILLFISLFSFAIEDTQVLPKGVRSFMWKQGRVGGITNKFGDDNALYSLDSRLSRNFDATEILKVHPRAPELINGLNNSLVQKYAMGQKLQLGELRFSGDAYVNYSAPIFAYGISDKWTLGVGAPITQLKADIVVRSGGYNNAKEIYQSMGSGILEEADRKEFEKLLDIDLVQSFKDFLQDRNYKPLQADESWQIGDLQVISKYRYYDSPKWTLLNKVLFNLPTGPEDDPDSLIDIPIFHRRYIEFTQVQDFHLDARNTIGTALTYQWNIADDINKRVPSYSGDYLPAEERKERVERDRGDAFRWETSYRTKWTSSWSTAAAYIGEYKAADYYNGDRGYDYALLSENSDTLFHKIELGLSYSSVEAFLNKAAAFPYGITYRYSDIISGRNVDKQKSHELTMMVFF